MKHISINISGKVQGVFFRASTKDAAEKLGIAGFVRNESDGSVYVEAEGEDERLKKFVEWCHHGPKQAVVDHVRLKEGSLKGFTKFEVKRL